MLRSRILGLIGLATALAVSGYGSTLVAQSSLIIGGAASNYGSRTLAPGFMPDPVAVPIVSGGNLDARTMNLGPGCIGYVTRQPDFILRMTGNSASLRIFVRIPGARAVTRTDATLLVNTGSGAWRCNDDSHGGANPTVDLPSAGPGQYDIWVGSYVAGANARGTLFITEYPHLHP